MINQQLLDFIKQQLQVGLTKEKISNDLLINGWTLQDIEEGFKAVSVSDPIPTPILSSIVNNPSNQQQTFQPQVQQPPTQQTSTIKTSNHSGKKIFFIILILVLLVAGASTYFFKDNLIGLFVNKDTTVLKSDVSIPNTINLLDSDKKELEQYLSTYTDTIPLKIVSGTVNKDDTVCKDQKTFVVALYDPILLLKNSLGRPIQADGSFITIVSKEGPQFLMLINNKKEVCLSTTSFPNNNNPIIFDTKSTIMSSAFTTMDEKDYPKFQGLKNFIPLYQFMQETLKIKTMSAISSEQLESEKYFNLVKAVLDEAVSLMTPKQ